MYCNVCRQNTYEFQNAIILHKYNIVYYKCENCGFIQTESPYWLQESYTNAIASLDIGLVSRNLYLQPIIEKILIENFDYTKKFIDFAGGYGLFVRLMRDKGFDFYRQDKYCHNIFAEYFDISDIGNNNKFEALTAFEVFEHLQNPLEDIKEMFSLSDTIIFSTELQPITPINNIKDWWYFCPETGQHISFYTYKTLEVIAGHFNCYLYSNGHNLHILSPKKFTKSPFDESIPLRRKVVLKINSYLNSQFDNTKKITLQGKLQSDYEHVKNIINK
jgi:2-polyprenyl-3-methyl-5-hydroxy-6-metoxy-1,4-benzoquinol methylase